MKAIVYYKNGPPDVLQLVDLEKPVPTDDQVLLKVHAASLNPLDKHLMHGMPFPLNLGSRKKMTQLGRDVSGTIEAVGKNVAQFKPGDEVFGVCVGSVAEYACPRASKIAIKPQGVSFEEAAASPVVAFTALQGLRDKGQLKGGQSVLINGAAGGVGTFAVQIGKFLGAEVAGVCSTRNLEMVRSLGAHQVFDYTKEDFTKGGNRYDLILDCIGNHSISEYRRILKPDGKYFVIGGVERGIAKMFGHLIKTLALSRFVKQQLGTYMAQSNQEDLVAIAKLMEDGTVKPVIDRTYSLAEVPDAMRHLEQGHVRGKVVIVVEGSS